MSQFDPQSQQQGQQGEGQGESDQELEKFLVDEHGHTPESAKQEVKRDREGVKAKKKKHHDASKAGEHSGGSSSRDK